MRPAIGITTTLKTVDYYDYQMPCTVLPDFYIHAVLQAGGLPVLLPPSGELLPELYLERVEGLLFSGGMDIDPAHYGQQQHQTTKTESPVRDIFELTLLKGALERNMPVLAVCRGMQILNVALGGDLCQDITDLKETDLAHWQDLDNDAEPSHTVSLTGGVFREIFRKEYVPVNSFHHQAVERIGDGLRIAGVSPDGIVEALESTEHDWVLGVQWHPEMMFKAHREQLALFEAFVQRAKDAVKPVVS